MMAFKFTKPIESYLAHVMPDFIKKLTKIRL